MIKKVISGGQIGADIAGLRAAQACGIETGGTAPKGYRTLHGRNPELIRFGLVEHTDWRYPPRTKANVLNSDGTIRFAVDWTTPGERATLREIKAAGRPYIDVTFELRAGLPSGWVHDTPVNDVRAWVREHDIRVLNVAGNGRPELEPLVEAYMKEVLGF